MDNPYWFTKGKTHNIDLNTIRRMCFELTNICSAGRSLADEHDAIEAEEKRQIDLSESPLLALYMEMAESQACDLLLQMALMLRTYDDIMKESDAREAYKAHVEATGDDEVGTLSTGKLTLRQACNKIIHANEIRALYDRVDRTVAHDDQGQELEQPIWFLTGEIELAGKEYGKSWQATLYAQEFIVATLERIAFGYPSSEPDEGP